MSGVGAVTTVLRQHVSMGISTMKIIAIVSSAVLLLSIAGSVSSQQGFAVSVDRCRSDLASWTNDFSYVNTAREDQLLTFDQLKSRIDEAKGCRILDAKEPYYTAAAVVQTGYSALMRDRLYDFLVRHNLVEQFQKEDANGLR
jgi:hypothetical protein